MESSDVFHLPASHESRLPGQLPRSRRWAAGSGHRDAPPGAGLCPAPKPLWSKTVTSGRPQCYTNCGVEEQPPGREYAQEFHTRWSGKCSHGGHSPWPIPLAAPPGTPLRQIFLAITGPVCWGHASPILCLPGGWLAQHANLVFKATLKKPQTYPRSPALTSETPPAGLQQDESFICLLNHYKPKQKPTKENLKQHHRGQKVTLNQLCYSTNTWKAHCNDPQSKYWTPRDTQSDN